MSKLVDLQYSLAHGENIGYIHFDEYLAVRRNDMTQGLLIHCQVRYISELETKIIEAITETDVANNLEQLTIVTTGGDSKKNFTYPLYLGDFLDVQFPNLKRLYIPNQYHFSTKIFNMEGSLGKNVISEILKNCPNLEDLELPETPQEGFGKIILPHLKKLKIVEHETPDLFFEKLKKIKKTKHFPKLESVGVSDKVDFKLFNDFYLNTNFGSNLKFITRYQ